MSYFRRSDAGIFASASISAHLVRGVIAFSALYWAFMHQEARPVLALGAGIVALIAFRGCPLCWSIGLVETVWHKLARPRKAENRL